MRKVFVIGHRNPDTDSVCSAIAYAHLKNETEGGGYEPCRAGNVNGETAFVLDHFGVKAPEFVNDVRPRMTDISLHLVEGVVKIVPLRQQEI
jgi:manganese-dependent inorganic pyrophosphatase